MRHVSRIRLVLHSGSCYYVCTISPFKFTRTKAATWNKYHEAENLPQTSVHCPKQNIKVRSNPPCAKKVTVILSTEHFLEKCKENYHVAT